MDVEEVDIRILDYIFVERGKKLYKLFVIYFYFVMKTNFIMSRTFFADDDLCDTPL
jgi:hypothetical protein